MQVYPLLYSVGFGIITSFMKESLACPKWHCLNFHVTVLNHLNDITKIERVSEIKNGVTVTLLKYFSILNLKFLCSPCSTGHWHYNIFFCLFCVAAVKIMLFLRVTCSWENWQITCSSFHGYFMLKWKSVLCVKFSSMKRRKKKIYLLVKITKKITKDPT